jgi:glycosyltransferase involved in cell wall biosynthesis
MHVLFVFHIAPHPPKFGPSKRNLPFFLEMLKRHNVSVLSFGSPEDEKNFRERFGQQCPEIVFVNNKRPRIVNLLLRISYFLRMKSSVHQMYSKTMQAELDAIVKRHRFDLVYCCTTVLGFHDLPKNIPLVGDMHNVEYDNLRRAYEQTKNLFLKLYLYIEYRHLKREEVRATKKFDVVITMTERDRGIISSALPQKRVAIIPHGVDAEFFEPPPVREEAHSIVFIGLMSYYPNHHGVLYFLDEIYPLIRAKEPKAKVYIVGAWPSKKIVRRANANIVVTGWVDDVKPYMARGQVFIIPLLIGGGMRGKALEAMAMRRPIVTTTLGCEGINLTHEESALFADTPGAFAECVLRMFNDADLRQRLTAQAHINVLQEYTWKTHGESLNALFTSLVPSNGAEHGGVARAPMPEQSARAWTE